MTARKPPPDTPAEAEFRAYAGAWAAHILAPERTDDDALDRAIAGGADPSQFRTALASAALRRIGCIRGHHVHARDRYVIGLCAAAVAVGIRREKARRIVGDAFGLGKATVRRLDRRRWGDPPGAG